MSCNAEVLAPIYTGNDNRVSLILFGNGRVLTSLASITQVIVEIAGLTFDSTVVGQTVIWWFESVEYRGEEIDVLRLKLGNLGIPAGTYEDVEITIFDAIYTNGLKIENNIIFTVLD